MMRALRFFSRWSPGQHHRFQVTTLVRHVPNDIPRVAPNWGTRQMKTWLSGSAVSSVRFYSQGPVSSETVEAKEHVSSPLALMSDAETAESKQSQNWFPSVDELQNCSRPSDVLDLISEYNGPHLKTNSCLTRMWTTVKNMSKEEQSRELQLMFEHPEFEKLLQKAMNAVGQMSTSDLSYSLWAMDRLRVPQRSRVVQTFLRACQEELNYFDNKSLRILASCLEHMDSSVNVSALKEGMRMQAENSLTTVKDPATLQTVIFLLGKDIPLYLKGKLERKAFMITDQLSSDEALDLMSTMAAVGFFSKPLLDIYSEKITENINGLSLRKLLTVLHSCRTLQYRNVNLLTAISNWIMSRMDQMSKKELILMLSAFEGILFCPADVLRAFAENIVSNREPLMRKDIVCVLKVYSSLNYDLHDLRQQFLDRLTEALESYLPVMSVPELLKAVYCLCLMGHFPTAPLEHLLQNSTLEQFNLSESKLPLGFPRMFQMVDLCLRLDCPPLPRQLTVPHRFLDCPLPTRLSVNPWLSHSLRVLLGDQSDKMLQEHVVVENIYLIDAVITKPLPLSERSSLESDGGSAPESSQRIAVICAPGSSFCGSTLRGPKAVMLRHLKVLGYHPVLIPQHQMKSVSDEKRIDFLRNMIFPEQHKPDQTGQREMDGLDSSRLESSD
ncbi:FAST kinase domain-containing protein 2, mitochondrial isoform X2 [Thalassophryne amazonica]|uniref:FAST kinase domain-containing protein 2, mitochondrial isoform X2 n=1 Tax=Thalassophryne amazonica TaxID=390379 RepID=UPI0014708EF1|nr:FAST kinase domain-containing protein 2, mitochondrial isoform X2 [Thalassophryne amazonica]